MTIVINTPNSTIGRRLAHTLLDRGEKLVLLTRSPDKTRDLAARGARLVEGTTDDPVALARAFEGAESVFWLTPPVARPDHFAWVKSTTDAAVAAAKRAGVKRAAVLSSVGAQFGAGNGPVGALLGVEEGWKTVTGDVAILRPSFFMENLLHSVHTIARDGAIYMPLPGDVPVPMVATQDIAQRAAEVLSDRRWTGHVYLGVHGPRDVTNAEAAQVAGELLGKPVRYVQTTLEQTRQGMLGAGMPAFAVDIMLEMYASIPHGKLAQAEPRTAASTTPTTLRQFAETVLIPAVRAAGG